ncbi:NAD(P)-dependent dehydrogenase (short-subunit alcohol dehydrogenase family) [Pseudomonas sp. GV085]|nr:NAD(P)-dependent dehydrogenase (short-subunit alcohol dehydrogenase family) [Pseudomonas sp. GV085]
MNKVEPCELTLDLSEAQPDGFLLAGRYTLLDHDRALQRLMDAALAQNVEIVVGGPYSSGILAGGAHIEYQKASPAIISKVEQIKRIAAAHGVDIKAAVLQFSLANPAMAAVIPAAFWQAMREAKLVSERAPLPPHWSLSMKIDLSEKLAIVSGSTAGIGLGISQALAEAGATVVVIGRDTAKVEQALASIRQRVPGAQLRGVTADLGTAEGAERLFDAEPRADILVNNLGIFNTVDFFDAPDSEWTRFYEVNVISGVRLSRHYTPQMVKQGWGRVIFLSSESGVATPADMINYGVTKSANLAVSHGLAKRLAGTGVTVNAILPGPTFTDGLEDMLKDATAESGRSARDEADAFVRKARPTSIIQRVADVEEVANLVAYIASPLSSATTGAARLSTAVSSTAWPSEPY